MPIPGNDPAPDANKFKGEKSCCTRSQSSQVGTRLTFITLYCNYLLNFLIPPYLVSSTKLQSFTSATVPTVLSISAHRSMERIIAWVSKWKIRISAVIHIHSFIHSANIYGWLFCPKPCAGSGDGRHIFLSLKNSYSGEQQIKGTIKTPLLLLTGY